MKEDKLINKLRSIIDTRADLAKDAYRLYEPKVELLIASKTKNKLEIERLLDGLLDFCFDDDILTLYRKVCKYYYTISPESTVSYIEYYKEMYDPDANKFGKTK
jgi:hypothetical protein